MNGCENNTKNIQTSMKGNLDGLEEINNLNENTSTVINKLENDTDELFPVWKRYFKTQMIQKIMQLI